jgi:hypothetical protein
MSRFEGGGYGLRIPEIALLDPNLSSDLPVQSLELVDGQPFVKADWVALGYTHYEVWCAGAAGGQGGDTGRKLFWPMTFATEPMPADVFNAWKWMMLYYPFAQATSWFPPTVNLPRDEATYQAYYWERGYFLEWQPGMDFPPAYDNYEHPGGSMWVRTGWSNFDTYANWQGSHLDFATWQAMGENAPPKGIRRYIDKPILVDDGSAIGGGGGGGGVHVMSGQLADIPDAVPVSVGLAGADAPPGQTFMNGMFTPLPRDLLAEMWQQRGDFGHSVNHPELYLDTYRNWTDVYPDPHPSIPPPTSGGDGGASAFGDICLASGGKGGGPSAIWDAGVLKVYGRGGDGGKGGTLVAGGGAAGSSSDAPGANGTWDGTVGTGGGGGRGGSQKTGVNIPVNGMTSDLGAAPTTDRAASDGGRGSLSYADTSVFGKADRKDYFVPASYGGSLAHAAGGFLPISQPVDQSTIKQIVPGFGGGVRVNRSRPVGSRADGYSPNGMVLIRLLKLA